MSTCRTVSHAQVITTSASIFRWDILTLTPKMFLFIFLHQLFLHHCHLWPCLLQHSHTRHLFATNKSRARVMQNEKTDRSSIVRLATDGSAACRDVRPASQTRSHLSPVHMESFSAALKEIKRKRGLHTHAPRIPNWLPSVSRLSRTSHFSRPVCSETQFLL